jgi:uncharacterized protein (TIGR00296 family)
MLSEEDGKFLVELARRAIETYLVDRKVIEVPEYADPKLNEDMGVFVTLNLRSELRGCIGYPEPVMPLLNAVIDAAISAATRDPRFNPLTPSEMDKIHVEVSVLSKPRLIEVDNPVEYLKNIKLGQDGLIVESGPYRGLLLPQVAIEWGWSGEEFLSNTCMKAGLPSDCWLSEDVKIYKFSSQIFGE